MQVRVDYTKGKFSKKKEVFTIDVNVNGRYKFKELMDAIRKEKGISGKIHIVKQTKLGFHV